MHGNLSVTILQFKDGLVGKCTSSIDCLQPYYFHTHLVGSEGSLLDDKLYSTALDNPAGKRIIASVRTHPFMVAGTDRFDTKLMQALPRVFVKTGAEGVYCGSVPHAGLGIALKCDDGASRASEAAMASVLASLDVWTDEERETLRHFARHDLCALTHRRSDAFDRARADVADREHAWATCL